MYTILLTRIHKFFNNFLHFLLELGRYGGRMVGIGGKGVKGRK